ncbi:hypothetical protein [Amphibacillus jilinensis]|uniref:hypothetical protein n=1 Tax=Amphibacillus jilinensis TaxID=1216008 RepID=UPI0003155E24|nr:hypothetical protein [Amphibacillus jilinensis]
MRDQILVEDYRNNGLENKHLGHICAIADQFLRDIYYENEVTLQWLDRNSKVSLLNDNDEVV